MEAISPQRILEESIQLLESSRPGSNDDDLNERIDNNVEDLKDLVKRLYMKGIYSI